MSKKSVAKNYIFNLFYQILAMIIPLITTPYLSRVLGAENIGIYSYTLSITTYFILFGALGVGMYGQREIAYVQDNIQLRSKTFWEIFLMRCITLGTSLIIFYLIFCIQGQYTFYYKILIMEIIANIIDVSWYFQGLEEFKKTIMRNTIIKFLSLFCIFILVNNQNDLYKYFIIYALSNLLGNFSLWMYMPKFICRVKIHELRIIKHLKPAIILLIPQIATQIYTVLDKTMIGVIVSDKSEVGFYEQAQKIIKLLMTVVTSLGTVMMPRIANIYAKGDSKKMKDYMNNSFAFTMMIAFPLMFGIISVVNSFVPIFYGDGYDKVIILITIISPIVITMGLSNVLGTQYLLPTKQQGKYTISVLVGAIVNFFCNIFLIKICASIGASIASVIAEFSVVAVQFMLVRKEFKIIDVVKSSYKYIIASILMFVCSYVTGALISNNLISIVIQAIVSVCVYFTLLVILKDKMIYNGIEIIRGKVIKKETTSESV